MTFASLCLLVGSGGILYHEIRVEKLWMWRMVPCHYHAIISFAHLVIGLVSGSITRKEKEMDKATIEFLGFFFVVGLIVFYVVIWWQIFSKAGYSGAMGLLMFIPLVSFIMLLVLAFSEWPVHKKLRELRVNLMKGKKTTRAPSRTREVDEEKIRVFDLSELIARKRGKWRYAGAEVFYDVLEPNEQPIDLCPAHDLGRDIGGTILITDKRLLFVDVLGEAASLLVLPYKEMQGIRPGRWGLVMKELIVEMEQGELRFGVGGLARQSIVDNYRRFKKSKS